jgi:lipopolysaccharide transport system ATP-binding protein
LRTSSDVVIEVRDLAKRYRLGERATIHRSLRDAVSDFRHTLFAREQPDWIWALDHVTFDVARGEVLGIIGRNGAGKTTLLKLLSGITDPTEGEARIWGRVGSLLEVGTGFHPELTGRENIFLNGAILGMRRREIEQKFDQIVDFSGVERFIDTPVKRYSSGMYLRLAFAVAAHLEPEVLVVDEVLAVGDAEFQRKCLGKMGEVSGEGRTVILVSHNMSAISSLSTRCMWLDGGRIREVGPSSEVVPAYLSEGHTSAQPGFADLTDPSLRHGVPKQIEREILFESIRLVDGSDRTAGVFFEKEPLRVVLGLRSKVAASRLEVLCRVLSLDGTLVFTLTSGALDERIEPGAVELAAEIPSLPLRRGNYAIDLYLMTHVAQDFLTGAIEFEVVGPRGAAADPRHDRDYLGVVDVEHEWEPLRQLDLSRTEA